MKAGYAIRQEQRALRGEVESLVKKNLELDGIKKDSNQPGTSIEIGVGGEVTALDTIYWASLVTG